jgi:hypothetical protein
MSTSTSVDFRSDRAVASACQRERMNVMADGHRRDRSTQASCATCQHHLSLRLNLRCSVSLLFTEHELASEGGLKLRLDIANATARSF